MDFGDTAEEAAFRREAAAWLEAHAPPRTASSAPPAASYALEAFLGQWSSRLGGGTEQVQRNIIAERILGLPGEPA